MLETPGRAVEVIINRIIEIRGGPDFGRPARVLPDDPPPEQWAP
jgi:hypothetical protein